MIVTHYKPDVVDLHQKSTIHSERPAFGHGHLDTAGLVKRGQNRQQ
jgi:hypothetical protein